MEEFISTEKQVLERAYQEWHGMQVIGASYSPQVQRNVSLTQMRLSQSAMTTALFVMSFF